MFKINLSGVTIFFFFLNYKDNAYHNFLQHYQYGGNLPFEARLIEIKRYEGSIHYSISFDDHTEFDSFYDSGDTIRNFLNLFELRFVPSD